MAPERDIKSKETSREQKRDNAWDEREKGTGEKKTKVRKRVVAVGNQWKDIETLQNDFQKRHMSRSFRTLRVSETYPHARNRAGDRSIRRKKQRSLTMSMTSCECMAGTAPQRVLISERVKPELSETPSRL